MADEAKKPSVTHHMPLRTRDDLMAAHEYLWNLQQAGSVDGKTADGMNTTLKGAVYLGPKMEMEAFKLQVMAHKAKMQVPPMLLPTGMRPKA